MHKYLGWEKEKTEKKKKKRFDFQKDLISTLINIHRKKHSSAKAHKNRVKNKWIKNTHMSMLQNMAPEKNERNKERKEKQQEEEKRSLFLVVYEREWRASRQP